MNLINLDFIVHIPLRTKTSEIADSIVIVITIMPNNLNSIISIVSIDFIY